MSGRTREMLDAAIKKANIQPGVVVQLHPRLTQNKHFSGMLMTVEKVSKWGAQGRIDAIVDGQYASAYYRAEWEEMDVVGEAAWRYPGGVGS